MDIVEFKRVVFACAKYTASKVDEIHQPGVTPNFFAAELVFENNKYFLLCTYNNEWAISENFEKLGCELVFAEVSVISEALNFLFKIQTLAPEFLKSRYLNRENHNLQDINYWQPNTMGDGIFNWWD